MICNITKSLIDWNGITVEISYQAAWSPALSESCGLDIAHLQVRSVAPAKSALPMTETGYRSHFVPSAEIIDLGGPVNYVRKWLDAAARSPEWQVQNAADRQYALF